MAQPVEAGVLKVFDVDGGHLVYRRVALLPQAEEKIFDWQKFDCALLPRQVFLKPEK